MGQVRGGRRSGQSGRWKSVAIWVGVFGLGILALLPMIRPSADAGAHPAPRAGITGETVLAADGFRIHQVRHAYAVAATIPEVLDGLYCHCDCSLHAGHRSLLTCFETEHGSQCDICMGQAELAYRLVRDGADLESIRAAVDDLYGS